MPRAAAGELHEGNGLMYPPRIVDVSLVGIMEDFQKGAASEDCRSMLRAWGLCRGKDVNCRRVPSRVLSDTLATQTLAE